MNLNDILMILIIGLGTIAFFFFRDWFKKVASKSDVNEAQAKTQRYLSEELTEMKLQTDERFDAVEGRVSKLEGS